MVVFVFQFTKQETAISQMVLGQHWIQGKLAGSNESNPSFIEDACNLNLGIWTNEGIPTFD